jgi:hypothetical protein
MNQKEQFVDTLSSLTIQNKIKWQTETGFVSSSVLPLIINPKRVSRVFYSKFNTNEIYFVVQKCLGYDPEADQNYERLANFILVLNNRDLVYSIYENEVSEYMLDHLLEEINGKIETNFYNNFIKEIKQSELGA